MELETRIGLKLHIPLATGSKLMCSCSAIHEGEVPNTLVCPICMGMPGALPRMNEGALLLALMAAIALKCNVDSELILDRELCSCRQSPKAYRHMQKRRPLGVDGTLTLGTAKKEVKILSVYMEEDICRNTDHTFCGYPNYNTCGVPMIAVECSQDLKNAEEMRDYIHSLFLMLNYLGVSEVTGSNVNIESEIRISVSGGMAESAGTVIYARENEDGLQRIVEYEDGRQQGMLLFGLPVEKEFFQWDSASESARSLLYHREETIFIPELEIPPVAIQDDYFSVVSSLVYELPEERTKKYVGQYHISPQDADVICHEKKYVELFEESNRLCGFYSEVAGWIANELDPMLKKYKVPPRALDLSPEKFAGILILRCNFLIDDNAAREILEKVLTDGVDPYAYAVDHSLCLVIDYTTIQFACRLALRRNLFLFEDYLNGDLTAFEELINSAMKELRGKAEVNAVRIVMEQEATEKVFQLTKNFPAQSDATAFDMKTALDVSKLLEFANDIDTQSSAQNALPLRAYGKELTRSDIENLVDVIVDKTIKEEGKVKFPTDEGTYEEEPHFAQNIDAIITEMVGIPPGDVTKSELFADYYAEKAKREQEENPLEPENNEIITQDIEQSIEIKGEEERKKPLTQEDEILLIIDEINASIDKNSDS